jgi:hypothetical protein
VPENSVLPRAKMIGTVGNLVLIEFIVVSKDAVLWANVRLRSLDTTAPVTMTRSGG